MTILIFCILDTMYGFVSEIDELNCYIANLGAICSILAFRIARIPYLLAVGISIYFLLLSDLGSFLDSFDIPCSWAGSISSVFHDPNAFCALPQG